MKKISIFPAVVLIFLFAGTSQARPTNNHPPKFVKYHITIQNEATGDLIGDWVIAAQDGVPTPLQWIREIPYRGAASTVTLPSTASAPTVVVEATTKSMLKTGVTLTVVPHVTRNGDVTTLLLLSYTTLDAMRTETFDGQTIDLPYTTTIHAKQEVLTTSAKPRVAFELNPQDKYMKPGDQGYGVPLMFKISAQVE